MCFWGLCCICCNTDLDNIEIEPPAGYQEAPDPVLCMACGSVAKAIYTVDNTRVGCCFLYCCECQGRNMALACRNCHSVFPGFLPKKCTRCSVYSFAETKYCGNCGLERQVYTNDSPPSAQSAPSEGTGGDGN